MSSILQLPAREVDEKVTEFIRAFRASLDVRVWLKLIDEEVAELREAAQAGDKAHILKEMIDVLYVMSGASLVTPTVNGLLYGTEEAKEIDDKVGDHCAEVLAIDEDNAFSLEVVREALVRVHASNMSKLGDDGKPLYREDGKVLKGPNYKAPDLSDLV
ncbi:hypothetical protein ACQU0X_08430 [Pseudovibrio ascidiaceicola]|uniref:hypothetical protein n=1 Tax=Pseudovibrio ascidiaceicola TaxID=285279 RepID=UPI003D364EFB